jgi:predicted transcriptional regulator
MNQGGREGLKPIKPESYREAVSYILQEDQISLIFDILRYLKKIGIVKTSVIFWASH